VLMSPRYSSSCHKEANIGLHDDYLHRRLFMTVLLV
jgi:hypothetical protein